MERDVAEWSFLTHLAPALANKGTTVAYNAYIETLVYRRRMLKDRLISGRFGRLSSIRSMMTVLQ